MQPERPITLEERVPMRIVSARIQSEETVEVIFSRPPDGFRPEHIQIDNGVVVREWHLEGTRLRLRCSPFDVSQNYTLTVERIGTKLLYPDGILDRLYSRKPLGCRVEGDQTVFRLFAPRAKSVKLVLYGSYGDKSGEELEMTPDPDRVWEVHVAGTLYGRYYGYRVDGPQHETELFNPDVVLADPYGQAVATANHYLHPAKTLILPPDDFDWQGDRFVPPPRQDLIIYEMHVRDLTAHPSAAIGPGLRGTYAGLIQEKGEGGINHIVEMGVNAVELLPVHDFANLEPPFDDPSAPVRNTWNPYARNHWGYMTSYFFAPESYYATGGTLKPGHANGTDGRQVRELKEVIKAFHRKGIAVLLDVVYNHVSNYDWNPLRYIDKKYYFRLDDDMNFLSQSGTGNDLRSERPMARRLILDSVRHWLTEYHVDGFRFDLAALLDWETIEQIGAVARQLNPRVILIAEAWAAGKYELAGFSDRDWAAWNDQIRNGVKGESPVNGRGFIFGEWWGANDIRRVQSYSGGSLRQEGGPFRKADHSVNYLESHDGYTLGDFIRIGSGEVGVDEVVEDLDAHVRLSEQQMKLNKLAALFLFTSQGSVMIHEGQEWARTKVIAPTDAPDPDVGKLDHNSYNKDNETNWLNFSHKAVDGELVEYYRGLIRLRKGHPAFRNTPSDAIYFWAPEAAVENDGIPAAFGFRIDPRPSADTHEFLVLLNGEPEETQRFVLPEGDWEVVVNADRAGTEPIDTLRGAEAELEPTSGMVLRRRVDEG